MNLRDGELDAIADGQTDDFGNIEETPGTQYLPVCSCGWRGGVGDSDNAYDQRWDHREKHRGHKTRSVRVSA